MYYKTFKTFDGQFYVYEANRNAVLKISKEEYESLSNIASGKVDSSSELVLKKFNEKGLLKPLNIEKIEHPNTDLIPMQFSKGINNIVLQITQGCNLTCSYCPYAGGNTIYKSHRTHAKRDISKEVIKKSIDLVEKYSLYTSKKYISFYGGEPLVRKDLIEFAVEYAVSKFGKDIVYFGVTTNGTLLTSNFIEKIKDFNFDILISADGPKETHNQNRRFADNGGSYDFLQKNLDKIKSLYPEIYKKLRFNVVIPPGAEYEEIFNYIRNKEGHLNFENTSLNTVSSNYAEESILYDSKFFEEVNYEMVRTILFLLGKIKEDASSHRNNINSIFMFEKFLSPIKETQKISHPAGTCIPGLKKLFINVDGDFYPCEKSNENSKLQKVGDLDSGFDFDQIRYLMNIASTTPNDCKNCWAFHLCSICPIVADDGYSSYYRPEYKLKKCIRIREEALNNLKVYCFLKEHGFNYNLEVI